MIEAQSCALCQQPLTEEFRALGLGYCRACLREWTPWPEIADIHALLERWFPGIEGEKNTRFPVTLAPGASYAAHWDGMIVQMVLLPNIHDPLTHEHEVDLGVIAQVEAEYGHVWATYALNGYQLPLHWRFNGMADGKAYAVAHAQVFLPGRRGYLTGYPERWPSEDVWRVQRRSNESVLSPAERRAWEDLRLNAPKHSGAERQWRTSDECRTAVLAAIHALRAEGVLESKITLERVAERVGYSNDRFKRLLHEFGFKLSKLKRGVQ